MEELRPRVPWGAPPREGMVAGQPGALPANTMATVTMDDGPAGQHFRAMAEGGQLSPPKLDGQGGGQLQVPAAPLPGGMDPGYDFRRREGMRGIMNNAAARGMLRSGATLQDLAAMNQELASQEYGRSFDRALAGYDRNVANQFAAYDRNQAARYGDYDRNLAAMFGAYDRNQATRFGEYDRNQATRFGEYDRNLAAMFGAYDRNQATRYGDYDRQQAARYGDYDRNLSAMFGTYDRDQAARQFAAMYDLDAYRTNLGAQQGAYQQNFQNALTEFLTNHGLQQDWFQQELARRGLDLNWFNAQTARFGAMQLPTFSTPLPPMPG